MMVGAKMAHIMQEFLQHALEKKLKCLKKGIKIFEDETVIVLLTCSPLGNASVDGKYNEKYVAMQLNILV